jgi:NAD(P)H dehydrogenase (quinone)
VRQNRCGNDDPGGRGDMEGKADAQPLIRERWKGVRVIELEGPVRVSPDDIAATFSSALGRPVHAQAVPRETWDALFRAQGMHNPVPRIRMLDGFTKDGSVFTRATIA